MRLRQTVQKYSLIFNIVMVFVLIIVYIAVNLYMLIASAKFILVTLLLIKNKKKIK